MRPALKACLIVTDGAFLIYWALSALDALGVIAVPRDWLYAGHDEARVIAWNWSFLVPDLAFSLTGLAAVAAARRSDPIWRSLALMSLCFTFVAGAMAIAYWAQLGEFEPSWFGVNLIIALWPWIFVRELVTHGPSPSRSP